MYTDTQIQNQLKSRCVSTKWAIVPFDMVWIVLGVRVLFANVWSTLMKSSACDLVSLSNALTTEPACVRLIYFSTWYTLTNHKINTCYPKYAMTTCYRNVKNILIGLSQNYIHLFLCLYLYVKQNSFNH